MHRSLTNAFALYVRTRPAASTESVNRAKQLSKEGQHPALLSLMPQQQRVDLQAEAQLAQFTSALRSFRPVATVFEAEVAGVKSAAAADAVVAARVAGAGGSGGSAVMSRKRAAHGSTIAREREKRARSEAAAAAAAGSEDDEGGLQGEGRAGASSARQAAMVAMEFGDGVLNEGKYR
jgi:ATP-dependent RNA helicase DDX54/DBP10